ncbi:hypothetical protein Leryth_022407 [Lithospermum erythrorhizon]|nr:hypothetical protein Leryth_022407 [Lithospermum erythrorhizon]
MQCPSNGLIYNTSQCACKPGYLLNTQNQSCILFSSLGELEVDSGVDYATLFTFPAEALFSFDSLKRFTQSQAVFLEATLFVLLTWLVFCFVLRSLVPLGDGRSFGFRLRWWISRLDVCFSTHHWLEDREVVKKRKTEIGGAFSMASWMLFIGLFAALLYQIISKRTVEVHNVRASNAPDLATFINDMEFNITTISSMTCSNLRGLQTVAIGYPGSIEHRSAPLSTFAKYSCVNTTKGPTISLRCNNCQPLLDVAYVSWYFIDLPNNPASAVGFQFNLTARNRAHEKHLSFVRGTLKNGSNEIEKTITFRGQVPNILKFNLFPRIYHNVHELKLIQPLFHEFLPGSYFSEPNELQASLQSAADGLINTTLYINFLSDYIVEIDSQNTFGTVSFLADLGGLFSFSIGIFFFLLVQVRIHLF